MRSTRPIPPTLADYLAADALAVGEPDVAGPLAVFPVHGPEPGVDYAAFAQARDAGLVVRELEEGASVNDLVVLNPTERNLLLYEGEEVLGAQQNRTFDVSVLVGAGTKLTVPVSCAWRRDAGTARATTSRSRRRPRPRIRRCGG